MKLFVQASLMAVLAISSITAVATVIPVAEASAATATALPWYRETIFYSMGYSPGTSPFPDPYGPTPGGTETRIMVGWHRYYCDGTVRTFGIETGDYEDYRLDECP